MRKLKLRLGNSFASRFLSDKPRIQKYWAKSYRTGNAGNEGTKLLEN